MDQILNYRSKLFPNSPECNRIGQDWMTQLPGCSLQKARSILKAGGNLQVHLDEVSTPNAPIWRATIADNDGKLWWLWSVKFGRPRQLKSVQQVYRVAQNLGLNEVEILLEG